METEDKINENEKANDEMDQEYSFENKTKENDAEKSKEEISELSGSEFGSDDVIPDEKPYVINVVFN